MEETMEIARRIAGKEMPADIHRRYGKRVNIDIETYREYEKTTEHTHFRHIPYSQ